MSEVFEILSNLAMRARNVWISHLATQSAIQKLSNTPWHDPMLDRFTNKSLMKEVGAAAMGYQVFLGESLVLALAKSLEDFWIDLKKIAKIKKYDIWKSPLQPLHTQEAKVIRNLGNVIKHNQSIIDKSSSANAKFLVDQAGFTDNIPLSVVFLGYKNILDLDNIVYQIFLYSLDLMFHLFDFKHELLKLDEPERRTQIANYLIPGVLGLSAVERTA